MSGKSTDSTGRRQPVEVEVRYTISCVSEINVSTSTFEVDIKLFYNWKDPNRQHLPVL